MRHDQINTVLSADLSTGRAAVEVYSSLMPPDRLFGFAERRNPKRSFLFVSRVLGRHVAVRPSLMRQTYRQLVAGMPADLPGPILVIGLAETAIGLGAGVHDSMRADLGRDDVLYLPSTRHPMSDDLLARFREEHSHASHHIIHRPPDPDHRRMAEQARTLVLVDDEVTSGRTFLNLAKALAGAGIAPQRILCASLLDWSDRTISSALRGVFPDARIDRSFLSEGRYSWVPAQGAVLPAMAAPDVVATGCHALPATHDWGRLGVRENRRMLDAPIRPGSRTLVIGTSEFVWQPFLLAEHLEAGGEDVRVAGTSRSPAIKGHAIEKILSHRDNYGLGLPNYLYNVHRDAYDRILLCIETPPDSVDPVLIEDLAPEILTTAEPCP